MIGLDYRYDPAVWQPVPTHFPDDSGLSKDSWVAGQAMAARRRGVQDSPTAGPVENFYGAVADFAQEQARRHDEIWMLVAAEAPGILIVFVDVSPADESVNDLLGTWAAHSDDQYEPATVTPVDGGLGEGYLVLRTDIDPEDRSIYVTMNTVFRAQGHDVIVSAQSHDTLAFHAAMPRIHEFMNGISLVDPSAAVTSDR